MAGTKNKDLNDIRAIIMDVDGVLTDGSVLLGNSDTELKSFNIRDGMAITIARRAGIKIGFITSRNSEAVQRRGEELEVDYLFQGVRDKLTRLRELSNSENIPLESICYIGDDIIDIPVLRKAGFSATVSDAPDEVKSCVSFISQNKGGREAVREIIRHILVSQDKWQKTIDAMVTDWEKGETE